MKSFNWKPWVGWVMAVGLAALSAYLGLKPSPIPPPPVDEEVELGPPPGFATGWVHDPIAVAGYINAAGVQAFSDTRAFRNCGQLPDHVYLWEAYTKATGQKAPIKNQGSVGSCVGFGTTTAVERTEANAIAGGRPGVWKRLVEEVTYGGSRVQIGGGNMRGDGSVGAWAAQFVKDYGVLPRDKYDKYDLRAYSESVCRQFGNIGCPKDLVPKVKEHPVGATALVRNWLEAKAALTNGYGIAVSSDQGFSMKRDSRGVCKASGVWYHCMCLDGFQMDADGKEYGHITNSWGPNAHTGPLGWGDPNPDGFWAEARVVDRMLRIGDSWAFSDVDGFPVKDLQIGIGQRARAFGLGFIPEPERN